MMRPQEIDGLRMIDQQVHKDNASRAEDVNELTHHPPIGRLATTGVVAPPSVMGRAYPNATLLRAMRWRSALLRSGAPAGLGPDARAKLSLAILVDALRVIPARSVVTFRRTITQAGGTSHQARRSQLSPHHRRDSLIGLVRRHAPVDD